MVSFYSNLKFILHVNTFISFTETHPLLSGPGKQQRSSISEKAPLGKAKGPRPGVKRAANGTNAETPSKRTKAKKSTEYYHNSSHY